MEIGIKLRDARKNQSMTQEQAAEILGVSRQTISNWENNKCYPDIISVIRMSDIYSVSLDHLLKEETSMKQTYQEFLDESTNVVRAKRRLEKVLLFSTYFFVWAIAMTVLWLVKGSAVTGCNIAFKCILLPLVLLITTVFIGRNNYWGKLNWLSVVVGAVSCLAVPSVKYVQQAENVTFAFIFPDFGYMPVGAIVAACGIAVGYFWNRAVQAKRQA